MFLQCILILCLSASVLANDLDLFSSMSDMQKLYEKEQELTLKLEQHLKTVDKQIQTIDKFLGKYYQNYNYTEDDAAEYVSHPINTFVLLKRTALEWPKVKEVLFNKKAEKEFEDILSSMDNFPGTNELEGALNGIFLLHETYDLNLTAFSLGRVEVPGQKGTFLQSDHQLYAEDLELLGKLAFNRGFYDRSYEFLKAAEWRAIRDNATQILASTRSALKAVIRSHDDTLMKKGPRGTNWKTYQIPFDKELAKKKKFRNIKEKKYTPEPIFNQVLEDHQLWDQFNLVCRGEKLRKPADEKNLSSFHLHFGDPYLRLGPFKIEVMNESPFAAVFHDFMYDNEIETYIDAAKDKLERSKHRSKTGGSESSIKRTSKQIWLHEYSKNHDGSFSPVASKISARISLATRFEVREGLGGEAYQVANYGIGGVYSHHTDASGQMLEGELEIEHGDRVATFMAYLSDVTAGGATGFPTLGLSVFPKKGNAIFWYNLDRNGYLDRTTYHGGCPVLKGSKWITNKWIRFYSQQLKFPCLTTANEFYRHSPLSNDVCKMTDRCHFITI